ncbi:MAG: hypothetical protein GC164_09555 [Phycisphaera sp.]|nr:hypothetical protein [Phycisphaera sp.]
MKAQRLIPSLITGLLLFAACTLAVPQARAQEAATLAPADAAVFIEFDNLARWRADFKDDELADYLRAHSPLNRPPEVWLMIQAAMGMTGDQIIDTYFGQTVALVAKETGDHKPGVIFTRVSPENARLVQTRFELREVGKVGRFNTFITPDGKGRFGFDDKWMAFAGDEHAEYFNTVLGQAGTGPSLAKDKDFRVWIGRLPKERDAVLFARDLAKNEVHTLALQRHNKDLTLHYAGTSDKGVEMLSNLGNAGTLDFGPLPPTTIAVASLNLKPVHPKNTAFLNRLLAPQTFEQDIAPKLDAPVVMFLGQTPSDRFENKPGFSVPAMGMAIKLKDKSVAADLDRALNGMVLIANVASAKWQTDPIELTSQNYKDHRFAVASVGHVLAQRTGHNELEPLKLAYGRVGDWYLVTTEAHFFTQCLDANDTGKTLDKSDAVRHMGLNASPAGPVGVAILRPQLLADHMQTWIDHWKQARPELFAQAVAGEGLMTPAARLMHNAPIAVGMMKHLDAVTLQMTHDGGVVQGRLEIKRKAD